MRPREGVNAFRVGVGSPGAGDLLTEEQAALRRVATLVASGADAGDVFAAVVDEAVRVLDVSTAMLGRFEPERAVSVLASLDEPAFAPGTRWPLDGPSVSAAVRDTGLPARVDDYSELPGTIAAGVRESGLRSTIGAPIVVDGEVWGVMTVATRRSEPLSAETEARLGGFTELVATAISNAESRDRLRRLADEQAALRRVATLVAGGASTDRLAAAVLEEVVLVVEAPAAWLLRYEPGRSMTVLAALNDPAFPPGSRWPLDGESVSASVHDTGGPVRIDDFSGLAGPIAVRTRESGFLSSLGVPITVEGTTWGAICVGTTAREPLPADAEERLFGFTELVALAISNTESRDGLRRLADEQAALRRLATLVAAGARPDELFTTIASEVAQTLGMPRIEMVRYAPDGTATVVGASPDHAFRVGSTWPLDGRSVMETVFRTGRPARLDDFAGLPGAVAEVARVAGITSAVGAPIVAGGETWGAMIAVSTAPEPISRATENRLAACAELVATAIANLSARDEVRELADEQASLRRVATLVAEGVAPDELFAAVAGEVASVLGVSGAILDRYEPDGTAVTLALAHDPDWTIAPKIAYNGRRWPRDEGGLTALVYETRRPARVDDYAEVAGDAGDAARAAGVGSGCATPIVVNGSLWGMIRVFSRLGEVLPPDAEARLEAFTGLVAAAVSNAQALDDLQEIAAEQAALRRVATLVAEGASADALFTGVAAEVAQVLGVSGAEVDRYEPDGTAVMLATWRHPDWAGVDAALEVGMSWSPDPGTLTAAIQATGRTARIDDYSGVEGVIGESSRAAGIGSAVAAPIVVDGRLWGAIRAFSRQDEVLAADAESRLQGFTDLVATAVSNAQAHDDLRGLADEQAALRRLATLVAEGTDSAAVFDAVCAEAGRLLGASGVNLSHYTSDGFNVTVAGWSLRDTHVPVGTRFPLTPDTIGGEIVRTHATVRRDSWADATSELARLVRDRGIRSSVGAPVVVEGQLWGALVAATDREETLPAGTEVRLARFTELIATAVSTATARSDLMASRARIVAAGDEARRRIERNLHDGTQQRLIAIGLDLQRIRAAVPGDERETREGLERAGEDLESVLEDVRELSRGLRPPMLSRRGLRSALAGLARRSPVPVELEIDLDERPPEPIETAVYYVVAEALANAIRHSNASTISVTIGTDHAGGPFAIGLDGNRASVNLHATIADDGGGGAEQIPGSGLMGLADRIDVLGGRFALESPVGRGTTVTVVLPLAPPRTPPFS
jgi:GAF domain-containing protein